MTLNETHIRELLEQATPGPWEALFDNEAIETDTSTVLYNTDGAVEWGRNIEHDVPLAALAPELAADWLRLRRELADFRAALQDGATNPELTSIDHSWCEATRDGIDRILNGETNA